MTELVLVVVDECTSPELCARVRSNAGSGPTDALVIAPTRDPAATRWYVDEDAARAAATHRLRACVACLRGKGFASRAGSAIPTPCRRSGMRFKASPPTRSRSSPRHSVPRHGSAGT